MAAHKAKIGWHGLRTSPTPGTAEVYGDPGTFDLHSAELNASDLRRLAGLVRESGGNGFGSDVTTASNDDLRAYLVRSAPMTFRPLRNRPTVTEPTPSTLTMTEPTPSMDLFTPDPVAPVTPAVVPTMPTMPTMPTTPTLPKPASADALGAIGDAIVAIVDERIDQHPAPINAETIEALVGEMIREAVEQMPARSVTVTVNDRSFTLDEHVNPAFDVVVKMAALRKNVFLVGPAGTGKTYMAEQVARALGMRFMAISCGPDMGKHELMGYRDAHGNYVSTMLREAYEADDDAGAMFLLDEVDRSSGAVMTAMNAVLANHLAAFADGMIRKGRRFLCLASGNTYGLGPDAQYVGAQVMDAAFGDRFFAVEVDYDRTLERTRAAAIMGAAGSTWCDTIDTVRQNIMSNNLRAICSTRTVIDGADVIAAGVMTPAQVIASKVTRGLSVSATAKIMAGVK